MSDSFFKNEVPEPSYNKGEIVTFFWETVRIIILSLAIILPVRYFIVQPFFVKGASMEPMFTDGDYILIDELSYRFSEPKRGDVVVFRYPQSPSQFFIKRIVGLPGEEIQIKNNQVTIFNKQYPKGLVLKEDYLDVGQHTKGDFKTVIGDEEYFVLGDNRVHSSDSRMWGSVDRGLITGKAFFRAWPLNKVNKFDRVQY